MLPTTQHSGEVILDSKGERSHGVIVVWREPCSSLVAAFEFNDSMGKIEVDPETYVVRYEGEELTCEPATVLPMAQRYFLF